MTTKVHKVLSGMKEFVEHALDDRSQYLTKITHFTRKRVLHFNILCFFILVQSKRSLSLELHEYFEGLGRAGCTKSAFSKARYRIKWIFFQTWFKHLVQLLYDGHNGLRLHRWKGFWLKAVDGTSLYLFKDDAVEKTFGGQSNQYGSIPMARGMMELDVLNGYCTQVQLQDYRTSETVGAADFLKASGKQDLIIYDRYFPSFELIYKHLQAEVSFLMRCEVDFNLVVRKFVAGGKKQALLDFPIHYEARKSLIEQGYIVSPDQFVRVRLLRVDIGLQEPEILITNLLDLKKYPHACFKELYGLRWGDETKFDQLKNKWQMEIFSGHSPEAIYQDFYANFIAANLFNLIANECTETLDQINMKRDKPVAINQNVAIGLLKPRLVHLFFNKKPEQIFEKLKQLFLAHLEPVRPGRKFPRTKLAKKHKGKYRTFKNYRRAS